MKHIEQWLEVIPLDTLFFRGGEPMEAGETHEAGVPIFPPVPETIVGALRAAILAQKGIEPRQVEKLAEDEDLDQEQLPFWGSPKRPGFSVTGPLLRVNGVDLFPAPATWFYQQADKVLKIKEAQPLREAPLRTKCPNILWVKNPYEDMEPLVGRFWLTRNALEREGGFDLKIVSRIDEISAMQAQVVPSPLLLKVEERVGIARDNVRRTVEKGYLYATRHLRLRLGVSLLLGLDKPLCPSHLAEKGIFQLGGEGRLVRYRLLEKDEEPRFPKTDGGRLLALSPLAYPRAKMANLLNAPYASGKLFRAAGWDMRKAFHKPTKTYFPAGAVFYTKKDPGLCELMPF